jgi:hypothetical protein
MNLRQILVATTLTAAALPAFAASSAQDYMMQACGRAFAAKLGLATGDSPGYKLTNLPSTRTGSLGNFSYVDYQIEMIARAPRTGTPVARASCLVSHRGAVISLTEQPLENPAAQTSPAQ